MRSTDALPVFRSIRRSRVQMLPCIASRIPSSATNPPISTRGSSTPPSPPRRTCSRRIASSGAPGSRGGCARRWLTSSTLGGVSNQRMSFGEGRQRVHLPAWARGGRARASQSFQRFLHRLVVGAAEPIMEDAPLVSPERASGKPEGEGGFASAVAQRK